MAVTVFGAPAASGSGAPTDAQYVVMASDSTLSAERVLTAGNHVTVANGGSTATIDWRYDPSKRVQLMTECNALGDLTTLASGTGASVVFTTAAIGTANQIGICRAACGTTTTGRSGIGSAAVDGVVLGTNEVRFCTIVKIQTASDATNNFVVHCGFVDNVSGTSTDGLYFEYNHATNAGDWTAIVRNNASTIASVDTNIAATAGSWYKLEIVVNAAANSSEFKINGSTVYTHTGTTPTGSARATGFGSLIRKTAGTTSRNLDIDFVGFFSEVTR